MSKSYDIYMCRPKPVAYTFKTRTWEEKIADEAEMNFQRIKANQEMIRIQTEMNIELGEQKRKDEMRSKLVMAGLITAVIFLVVIPRML